MPGRSGAGPKPGADDGAARRASLAPGAAASPRAAASAGVITSLSRPEEGGLIVKTIDHRPASEVWRSWLDAEDAAALAPWVDDPANQPPLASAPAFAHSATNPMGIERSEGVVMVCVMGIHGGELQFLPGVDVEEGEVLFPQHVDRATICSKTHEAAKRVCAKQSVGTDDIRGAFTFSCAINAILGGDEGMQDVSDKMACALGSAPLFGITGGPELGHAYGSTASFACVMYSCLVFQ